MMTGSNRRRALAAMFVSALLLQPGIVRAELNYSCDELANMAVRFYNLKHEGHDLETILTVIQKSTGQKPEKAELLYDLAIQVYVDPSIASADAAHSHTVADCTQGRSRNARRH
jgi:hypothetical protein